MAPPPPAPATPNPHRFAPSKQSKPPVYLGLQHQTPGSTSSQFAPTPRFSFGSQPQKPLPASIAPTGPSPSPRPPPLFSFSNAVRKKPEIEDIGSDDEANTQHPRGPNSSPHIISETISDPTSPTSTPVPPKRRRLNDAISISSSPSPSPPPPPQPSPPSSPSHHHIYSPQTHPSSPPLTSTHTQPFILSPKRPPSTPHPFILPPRSPSPQPQPIHPIFSPHRRGGPKFLPGGMAHTLRDWVVEIASSVPVARDGDWDLRFRVKDFGGGGRVSLVEEDGGGGEGKRWMLVGDCGGQVGRGVLVGVRRPVWEVVVEGEVWGVGVDWGVC